MNVALWVVQGLLAAAFLTAGITKVIQPREKLVKRMAYVEDFSTLTVRAIGTLEILGAVGVVLPRATGVLPWLTPVAAVGLVLTMVGAVFTHLRRREPQLLPVPAILLVLAVVAAVGRSTNG